VSVGVPGAIFTLLGQEIKRRSPYRETLVFELVNDDVGYLPDRVAFERGGYQARVGRNGSVEKGSGETIVDGAVQLLEQLRSRRHVGGPQS
jgi:hypothetical protein